MSTPQRPAIDYTEADFDFVLDVNLKAYFFFAQAAAKVMIAGGGGAIASNSSICRRRGDQEHLGVQHLQGRREHDDQVAGPRMGAARHPRQRVLARLHGGVHARRRGRARRGQGAVGARSHAAGSARPARGARRPGRVPRLRCVVVCHRRGADGRRRLDDVADGKDRDLRLHGRQRPREGAVLPERGRRPARRAGDPLDGARSCRGRLPHVDSTATTWRRWKTRCGSARG